LRGVIGFNQPCYRIGYLPKTIVLNFYKPYSCPRPH
jgi:hypothetical protein